MWILKHQWFLWQVLLTKKQMKQKDNFDGFSIDAWVESIHVVGVNMDFNGSKIVQENVLGT